MARRRVSNLLALAVLSCLVEQPMHPYQISTTLRTRGKDHNIKLNYGSLYSVVDSLAKHGLIEPKRTLREGRRPERTVYDVTAAGRAEFEDWMAELISTPVREYTSLEAALALLGGVPPDESARLLRERVERLRIELGSIDLGLEWAAEHGVPELFVVEEQYRQALLEAELGFVARLAERIETGDLPGTVWWRRMHELAADSGVTMADIIADPAKYLGDEAAQMLAFLGPGAEGGDSATS
ncbi:MAG TPA: PadR family transcriptional regulator [Nocardioidaceae bacterium]|nr:PadR family transcriptional regulator [Nocardioidaceae bacterium]